MSLDPFYSAVGYLTAACSLIAKLSLLLIVVAVTADSMGRYLFGAPIRGTHAIAGGLLQPAVVFFFAGQSAKLGAHMKVEVLSLSRVPVFERWVRVLFKVLIILFWLGCGWQAYLLAYAAFIAGRWPIGEIAAPEVIAYSMVAFGCLVAAAGHAFPAAEKPA